VNVSERSNLRLFEPPNGAQVKSQIGRNVGKMIGVQVGNALVTEPAVHNRLLDMDGARKHTYWRFLHHRA